MFDPQKCFAADHDHTGFTKPQPRQPPARGSIGGEDVGPDRRILESRHEGRIFRQHPPLVPFDAAPGQTPDLIAIAIMQIPPQGERFAVIERAPSADRIDHRAPQDVERIAIGRAFRQITGAEQGKQPIRIADQRLPNADHAGRSPIVTSGMIAITDAGRGLDCWIQI